jgi:hypothetical protein
MYTKYFCPVQPKIDTFSVATFIPFTIFLCWILSSFPVRLFLINLLEAAGVKLIKRRPFFASHPRLLIFVFPPQE